MQAKLPAGLKPGERKGIYGAIIGRLRTLMYERDKEAWEKQRVELFERYGKRCPAVAE